MSLFDSTTESSSTTSKDLAPPSPEEQQLLNSQIDLAAKQLKALGTTGAFTFDQFKQYMPTLQNQVNRFLPQMDAVARGNLDYAGQASAAQSQLLDSELAAIANGVQLTPDQAALIHSSADSAVQGALSDIGQFRDESLRQIGQELTPARGLRPDDTPIRDSASMAVNEAQRLAEKSVTAIRGNEAQQMLQYPIQAGTYLAGRTQAQQTLAANTAQWADKLRQDAFNNRLNLTSSLGQLGLGLSSIGPSPSTLAGLQSLRLGSATVNQEGTTTTSDPMGGIAGILGGLGGLGTGLGAMGFKPSDPRLKENVERIGEIGGHTLYSYNFKGIPVREIGVMADEVPMKYVAVHKPTGMLMVNYPRLFDDAAERVH